MTPKTDRSRETRIQRIHRDFKLESVCCAQEVLLTQRVQADESLCNRLDHLLKHLDGGLDQMLTQLMTEGFLVDPNLTPRLTRLVSISRRILNLSTPIDLYVLPRIDCNAFCQFSRNGNRFILGVHSGLLSRMSTRELAFVIGHEIGHAVLQHGEIPNIRFDDPNFSWVEAIEMRRLSRAREITCDRFGLLVCQDLPSATRALFKTATGLDDRWATFNERHYAQYYA